MVQERVFWKIEERMARFFRLWAFPESGRMCWITFPTGGQDDGPNGPKPEYSGYR